MFEATFLTSRWSCIFGNGCKGIVDDVATGRAQGCCSHGVYVGDDDDKAIVEAAVARLPVDLWENAAEAPTIADVFVPGEGGQTMTATHNGGCIFLNSPEFHTGPGCALHFASTRLGGTNPEWKPEACWQLPVRLEHATEGGREDGRTIYVLRRWERSDWGDEGEEFAWWCTDAGEALVGDDCVYRTLEPELRSLLGDGIYDAMAEALTDFAQRSGSTPVEISNRP